MKNGATIAALVLCAVAAAAAVQTAENAAAVRKKAEFIEKIHKFVKISAFFLGIIAVCAIIFSLRAV